MFGIRRMKEGKMLCQSATVPQAAASLPHHRRAPFGHPRAASRAWARGRLRGRARAAAGTPRSLALPV